MSDEVEGLENPPTKQGAAPDRGVGRYESESLPERFRESYRKYTNEDPQDVYAGRSELDLLRAILDTHMREYDQHLEALTAYYEHWDDWKAEKSERKNIKPPVLKLTPPEDLGKLVESIHRIRSDLRKEHNEHAIPFVVWNRLVYEMRKAVESALLQEGLPSDVIDKTEEVYLHAWQAMFKQAGVL